MDIMDLSEYMDITDLYGYMDLYGYYMEINFFISSIIIIQFSNNIKSILQKVASVEENIRSNRVGCRGVKRNFLDFAYRFIIARLAIITGVIATLWKRRVLSEGLQRYSLSVSARISETKTRRTLTSPVRFYLLRFLSQINLNDMGII